MLLFHVFINLSIGPWRRSIASARRTPTCSWIHWDWNAYAWIDGVYHNCFWKFAELFLIDYHYNIQSPWTFLFGFKFAIQILKLWNFRLSIVRPATNWQMCQRRSAKFLRKNKKKLMHVARYNNSRRVAEFINLPSCCQFVNNSSHFHLNDIFLMLNIETKIFYLEGFNWISNHRSWIFLF